MLIAPSRQVPGLTPAAGTLLPAPRPAPAAWTAGQALTELYRDHYRPMLRRQQTAERYAPAAEPDAPSAEHGAILRPERAAVTAALRQLPPRQREILVLRFYLDLSVAQTAETIGISSGAVKAHTARAMAALRQAMAGSGRGPVPGGAAGVSGRRAQPRRRALPGPDGRPVPHTARSAGPASRCASAPGCARPSPRSGHR